MSINKIVNNLLKFAETPSYFKGIVNILWGELSDKFLHSFLDRPLVFSILVVKQ